MRIEISTGSFWGIEAQEFYNKRIMELKELLGEKTMNDLISRKAAIETVREAYENDEMLDGYEYRLEELPSAQPKGKWIDRGNDYELRWECSECKERYTHIFNYCPNCGAYMRTEDGEWA